MRIAGSTRCVAAWVLTVAILVLPGCNKRGHGVFLERAAGKPLPLFRGTVVEMAARAVPVTGTTRPSFLVDLPKAPIPNAGKTEMPEVRLAVDLTDGKAGPFQRADATVAPVEGKNGVFKIAPTGDLPSGLCAVVVGAGDELVADKDNVYPFRIVLEQKAG
jgi:hypothetical protein